MGPEGKANFEKLSKGNYLQWAYAAERFLRQHNLWKYIEPPAKAPDNTAVTTSDCEDAAINVIIASISSANVDRILGCDSAQRIWRILKDAHIGNTTANMITYEKQFYNLTLDQGEDASDYVDQFNRLLGLLRSIDEDLYTKNPSHLAQRFLIGLNDAEYGVFKTTMVNHPDIKRMTVDMLADRLLQQQIHTETDLVNRVDQRRGSQSARKQKEKYSGPPCTYCDKGSTHPTERCFKKRADEKMKSLRAEILKEARAMLIKEQDCREIQESGFMVLASEVKGDSIYIDSGCTRHMLKDAIYSPQSIMDDTADL